MGPYAGGLGGALHGSHYPGIPALQGYDCMLDAVAAAAFKTVKSVDNVLLLFSKQEEESSANSDDQVDFHKRPSKRHLGTAPLNIALHNKRVKMAKEVNNNSRGM